MGKARNSVVTSNQVVMPENYATFQLAVDAARTLNRELVLASGKTYTLTAAVTDAEVTIRGNGAILDMSGLASGATGLTADGSNAYTGVALTSNSTAGSTSIVLASVTGISAGTWLFIRSSAAFNAGESVTYGEWVRCASVAALTVTTYAPLAYTYNTADTAVVDVLSPAQNFTWQDFTIVGSNSGTQRGALIDRAVGVQIRNVSVDKCWNSGIGIRRSNGVDVSGGMFSRANQVGISYGIIIYDGCTGISVAGVTGFDLRHTVTIGGTGGVNRGIEVQQCKAFASRDAGFDSHGGADGVLFGTLYVEGGSTSVDGVVMQGVNCTARDIEVRNIQRYGVIMQHTSTPSGSGMIEGVRGDADTALVFANAYGGNIAALSIEDVLGYSDGYLVLVNADAGKTISRVMVRNVASSTSLPSRGIKLYADGASAAITNGAISDVDMTLSGGSVAEGIYLQTNAGGAISGIEIDSARITGGTYGLRLNGAASCVIGQKNMFSSQSTGPISWGAGAGNRGYRYEGSATYNPANLIDGAGVTTTVTVTGAVLGDAVTELSFSLDLQGITLTAWVSAADTVSVRFQNETGGPIDLASGTLRAAVVRMTT